MITRVLNWLLPLYIFLLPWQARFIFLKYSLTEPFYGDKSLYATDLLFFILLGVWIVWVHSQRAQIQELLKSKWLRRAIFALAIVFAYSALSLLWAPHTSVGYDKLFRLSQALLVLVMLSHNPVIRGRVLAAFFASACVQSVWAIVQFLQQSIAASTWLGMSPQNPQDLGVSVIEYADERWLRAYGSLSHPNMLGGFLSIAALMSLGVYLQNAVHMVPWYSKWASMQKPQMQTFRNHDLGSFITFLLSFIGLLLTFSRSAWLGFAVGLALIIVSSVAMYRGQARRAVVRSFSKLTVLAIILFVFLNAIFGGLWFSRTHDQSRLAQVSVTERSQLLGDAKQIIMNHPFRGVGLGGYLPTLMQMEGNRFEDDRPIFRFQPVHNTWLLLWAELGLVGLFLFFVWIYSVLVAFKARQPLFASILAAVGIMFYFDHFWLSLPFGMILAAVALAITAQELTEK